MPYYIYKVTRTPIMRMEKLEQHDGFRVASARAKELRLELALPQQSAVKVVFAEHELGAEDLLMQVRDPTPEADDD